MAYEVTLPRLGWDMEEGAMGSWLKNDGEFVKAGEPLFTVEGDKAVQEIEALDSGHLRILPSAPAQGTMIPVGTLLAYLVPKEELANFSFPESAPAKSGLLPDAMLKKTGMQPSITPMVMSEANGGQKHRVWISPYAKRMAQGLGIAWKEVKGSGYRGRIMARDIQEAAEKIKIPARVQKPLKPVMKTTAQKISASGEVARIPISQTRKSIADHMLQSAQSTVPVTLMLEADATEMVVLRKILKGNTISSGQVIPSYSDMLAKIAARALMEYPNINARVEGDQIVQFSYAHIGLAVDTDRGLLVPVLHDVQVKSLLQIARESAALVEKTRQGTISYEDLQGGTFTITNLGMFEITTFTPVINYPQTAILGVGQIIPKQVVVDAESEKVVIQQRMIVSLTFDHRMVDGAQAARFLQRIKHFVETPFLWLAG